MKTTRQNLIEFIDHYQDSGGLNDRRLSLAIGSGHGWVSRLRRGGGVSLTSIEKAEAVIFSFFIDSGVAVEVGEGGDCPVEGCPD
ncbi:hypothetical protein [Kiloniella laminariae]|uniref:hypothetical protein n=1 Tax=Kiloniella laminariae TaxID=454162 RepID=UPI0012F83F71|nr:hypothetical protein [Kiloniella laminariae]